MALSPADFCPNPKCGYLKGSPGHRVICEGEAPPFAQLAAAGDTNGQAPAERGPSVEMSVRKLQAASGVGYADVMRVMHSAADAGLVSIVSQGGRTGAVYARA